MAYIPTEWHAGDPIDKKKLMKIENELAVLAENLTALGVPEITSIDENSVTIDTNTVSIDSIQGILLYGTTTQNGTPSPDNPIDITPLMGYDTMTGSGSGATYSRSNEYDPLDDQYYAIQISDGTNTAWIGTTEKIAPLYDGDTIDFIAGQVIRNNDVETLAIADMDNSDSYPGWKGDWEKYNGSGSNKEMFTTKGNYSSIGAENTRVCRISNTDGALYRPYGVLNNRTQTQWIELYPNLVITFVLKLTTAVTENVTINSSFPNLTGELTISSTGKLSIKFFPNLKNYIDNQVDITPTVSSVNGKTGAVVLDHVDVGAAPAIVSNSSLKHTFSSTEISAMNNGSLIIPTVTGVTTERIAYQQDLLPFLDAVTTDNPSIIHTANTNTAVVNGTFSSEKYVYLRKDGSANYTPSQAIHAEDTISILIHKNKNINTTNTKPFYICLYLAYTDNSSTYLYEPVGKYAGFDLLEFTPTKDVSALGFYLDFEIDTEGSYDNVTISWATILNGTFSEKSLNSNITINKSVIASTGITMLPANGYLKNIEDTKTYIDTHVPTNMLLEEDLVYVSPEMYGAVGNGSNDDTTAVQNCINYAKTHNVPVRGFQKYRVTSTININARDLDVHLGKIIRSGAGAAVKFSGKFNKFTFHEIEALSTGGIGIDIVNTSDYDTTERNRITGDKIYAENASINFGDDPSGESFIMYTVLDIKTLYSQNWHCVYCNRSRVTETSLYNAYFACQNGWCVYGTEVHLYNATMESNCYGGVYATSCQMYGVRVRELEDALMPGNPYYGQTSGIVFKYQNWAEIPNKEESDHIRTRIIANDTIYYDAIDLSEYTPHQTYNFYNGQYGIIDNIITYGDANYANGYVILGKRMYIHGDKKICEPLYPSVETITSTPHDMSDSAGNHYRFSTRFIIDVADCVITLSPSYTASGIKEFEIIQYDATKLTTVYDCNGNMIFDPTVYGVGRYKISAEVDYDSDPTIEDMCPEWPANNENMNIWTVEKIVSAPCTSLTLSESAVNINSLSNPITLTTTTVPANTSDYTVWTSSNTSVVTVYRGQIKFVGAGSATITAHCGNQTATCSVTATVQGNFTRLSGIWTTCDTYLADGAANASGNVYFWPSTNRGTIVSSTGSLKINDSYIDDKTGYYPYPLPVSTTKISIDVGASGLLLDCVIMCNSTTPAKGTTTICSAVQRATEDANTSYEVTIPTISSDLPAIDSAIIVLKAPNDGTMTAELLNQVTIDFITNSN